LKRKAVSGIVFILLVVSILELPFPFSGLEQLELFTSRKMELLILQRHQFNETETSTLSLMMFTNQSLYKKTT